MAQPVTIQHRREPAPTLTIVPRLKSEQLTVAEQDFDVWYDGEPDVIGQHTAANEHNARFAMWLKRPRRAFWMYRARVSVTKLQSLGLC